MPQARMLLDLLKAPGLCMVCYGNVSSMRHIYGKTFDNTRQHIFLKTDARKLRSQWSLNFMYRLHDSQDVFTNQIWDL